MGEYRWVIDKPGYDEVVPGGKHYHDYALVPFKLTLQGIEFGVLEEGNEVTKELSGLKPAVYISSLIVGGMVLWSAGKSGLLSGAGSLIGGLLGAAK